MTARLDANKYAQQLRDQRSSVKEASEAVEQAHKESASQKQEFEQEIDSIKRHYESRVSQTCV